MNAVQDALDVVPVTDTVYHHLAYTRPLVDAVAEAVRRACPRGRVLVVGPNELLPAVLLAMGYDVDLWVLDGLPLSAQTMRHASRIGSLEKVLAGEAGEPANVVIVPYVLESTEQEAAEVLASIGRSLKPGGHMVVVCRQAGELRARLRGAPAATGPPSPTWPDLPARRLLTGQEVVEAAGGSCSVVAVRYVLDHRAAVATEPLGLVRWLRRQSVYFAKLVAPRLRDCVMVTLERSG